MNDIFGDHVAVRYDQALEEGQKNNHDISHLESSSEQEIGS
jgi:hypothetical protein